MDEASRLDFAWLLFVGIKLLGFSTKEVGHFTLKKWSLLYKHFRNYHNFKAQNQLFKETLESLPRSNDEWFPD